MLTSRFVEFANRIRSGPKSRATFYYGGSSLVCQALRFCGILVSTARIHADQFGVFATAVMLVGLTCMVREVGQNSALLSSPGLQSGYPRAHLLVTFSMNGIVMILTIGAVLIIPSLRDIRGMWPLLLLQLLFETMTYTPMIVAQKKFAFKGLALVEMLAVAIWLLITVFAAFCYPLAITLVAARVGETAVRGSLLFVWQFPTVINGRVRPEILRYYFSFAKLLTPKSWVETFGANLDVLLLKLFTNNVEIGIFDRTMQLLRIPLALSVNLIDAVAGASYSREQDSSHAIRGSLRKFSLVILLGTLAGLVMVQFFLWFVAEPILGKDWKQNIEAVWLWAIPFTLLRPFFWNFNILFQSTGRPKELLWTLSLATGLFLLLGLVATPTLGIRGVFLALAAANLITLFFQIRWVSHRQMVDPKIGIPEKHLDSP
jgi:O-antigen/teichoic acid export membrane protein